MTTIDYKGLCNVEVDGVDYADYPDFCDAFISYAEIDGVELNDEQYEELNNNSDYVYEKVMGYLY